MKGAGVKLAYLASLVVVGVASAGVTLAFTSQDFASRAQSWVNSSCDQKLLKSKSNDSNNQIATECFNYFENVEQDSKIASLGSQAMPALYDGNNNELGITMDASGNSFYSPTLKRFVALESIGGGEAEVYQSGVGFATQDCTGTAYIQVGQDSQYLTLLKGGSKYYVANPGATSVSQTMDSYYMENPNTHAVQCVQVSLNGTWYPLTPTNIPFSDPIPEPLHLGN